MENKEPNFIDGFNICVIRPPGFGATGENSDFNFHWSKQKMDKQGLGLVCAELMKKGASFAVTGTDMGTVSKPIIGDVGIELIWYVRAMCCPESCPLGMLRDAFKQYHWNLFNTGKMKFSDNAIFETYKL